MDKKKLGHGVFCVENFLSKESLNILLQFCKDQNNWVWDNETIPQKFSKNMDDGIHDDVWLEINEKLKQVFVDQSIYVPRITNSVSKSVAYNDSFPMSEDGLLMGPHSDDFGYKKGYGIIDENIICIKYACILYLNEDFDGGEIVYNKKNLEVKPKTNMLIVHSGSDEHEHSVKQVYNGDRYSVPFFIVNKECL